MLAKREANSRPAGAWPVTCAGAGARDAAHSRSLGHPRAFRCWKALGLERRDDPIAHVVRTEHVLEQRRVCLEC
jgi:hypothetical protein